MWWNQIHCCCLFLAICCHYGQGGCCFPYTKSCACNMHNMHVTCIILNQVKTSINLNAFHVHLYLQACSMYGFGPFLTQSTCVHVTWKLTCIQHGYVYNSSALSKSAQVNWVDTCKHVGTLQNNRVSLTQLWVTWVALINNA